MKTHTRAFIYLLLAATLWSLGGVLIKGIPWPALTLAGVRSLVAFIFFILIRRGWKIRFTAVMCFGALAYAATLISFVLATKMTTAANAILLQYTAPVYVAIFSVWFLKENVQRSDIAIMALVLGGMGLFFLDKLSTTGLVGNLVAIFSGLCFGWLVLLLRKQKAGTPLDTVILGNLLVVLFCLPFLNQIDAHPAHWIGIIILGVLQIAVAYILYTLAIREVRAIEAILITTLEPILNPTWVFLFLGERPGHWALLGGSLVIGAILLHQFLSSRKPVKSIG